MEIEHNYLESYILTPPEKRNAFINSLLPTTNEYLYLSTIDNLLSEKSTKLTPQEVQEKVLKASLGTNSQKQLVLISFLNEFADAGTTTQKKQEIVKEIGILLGVSNFTSSMFLSNMNNLGKRNTIKAGGNAPAFGGKGRGLKGAFGQKFGKGGGRWNKKSKIVQEEEDDFEEEEEDEQDDDDDQDEDEMDEESDQRPIKKVANKRRTVAAKKAPKKAPSPLFGQTNTQSTSLFGNQTQQSLFGGDVPVFNNNNQSLFGTQQPQQDLFAQPAAKPIGRRSSSRNQSKMDIEGDDKSEKSEQSDSGEKKQKIQKRASKMSVESDSKKKTPISRNQSMASVKSQPTKRGKKGKKGGQQDQNSTQQLIEMYTKDKFQFANINTSYYEFLEFEQLPEDLDLHTKINFLSCIQVSKREGLVDYMGKIIQQHQKPKLYSNQFDRIYANMSYDQMEQFCKKHSNFVFEDTEFFIKLLMKKFQGQLKYFQNRYFCMKNQDKHDYIAFLTDLKVWLEKVPPKNMSQEYLLSKIMFCLVQVTCELEIYDEEVFKRLLKKPSFLQGQLHWLLDQNYNRRINDVRYTIDQQIFLECSTNHALQICGTYLYHILLNDNADTNYYYKIIEEHYLDLLLARVTLEAGEKIDDDLKEKIDSNTLESIYKEKFIFFCQKNEKVYNIEDQVNLQLYIKNIEEITINVFEIDPKNYYLDFQQQIDQKLNLDGIIPQYSKKHQLKDQENGIRKQHDFPLAQIKDRGVYVTEVSGDGILSRAIVKKGALTLHMQNTMTDRKIKIMNEKLEICLPKKDSETGIYINKQFFPADKDGIVSIPQEVVRQNQNNNYILVHDGFAELIPYNKTNQTVNSNNYKFDCVYMAQEENFIKESKAHIVVSPRLFNMGQLVEMNNLKDCKIHVVVDYQKIGNRQFEFQYQFNLNEDVKIEFPIITKPQSVRINTSCVMEVNKVDQKFSHSKSFSFQNYSYLGENQFSFNSMHLRQDKDKGYIIQILTKDGQQRSSIPVDVNIENIYFTSLIESNYKSDENGEVLLGYLNDCRTIRASINENEFEVELQTHEWYIQNMVSGLFDVQYPPYITELLGNQIQLPVKASGYDEEDFAIQQIYFNQNNQQQVIADQTGIIQYDEKNNQILLNFKESGDYLLKISTLEQEIPIKIVKGNKIEGTGFIMDEENLQVEKLVQSSDFMVQIKEVNFGKNSLEIQLEKGNTEVFNPEKLLRVHVFGYNFFENQTEQWFMQQRQAYMKNQIDYASQTQDEILIQIEKKECSYLAQKIESEEMVYSLQRRNQEKFLSLNIEKPQLFLKKAFYSTTNNQQEQMQQEQDFIISGGGRVSTRSQTEYKKQQQKTNLQNITSRNKILQYRARNNNNFDFEKHLDFLENSCLVAQNCKVSANGKITIKDFPIGNYQMVGIYCSNFKSSIYRNFQVPRDAKDVIPRKELSLQKILDKKCGFQENREINILQHGEHKLVSKQSEKLVISSLPNVYNIFLQRNMSDQNYHHWQFLKAWNTLNFETKCEIYNEFSSHELNLFIYFKDNQFFNKIVKGFLSCKLTKTFVDYFLLDMGDEIVYYSEIQNIGVLNIMEKCLLVLYLIKNGYPKRANQINQEIQLIPYEINENLQKNLFDEIVNFQMNDDSETRKMNTNKYQDNQSGYMNDEDGTSTFGGSFFGGGFGGNSISSINTNTNVSQAYQNYLYHQIQDQETYNQSNYYNNNRIGQIPNPIQTKQFVERSYFQHKTTDNQNLVIMRPFWKNLSEHIVKHKSINEFTSQYYNYDMQYTVTELVMVLTFMDLNLDPKQEIQQKSIKQELQITNTSNSPILIYEKNTTPITKIKIINDLIIKQKLFDPFNQIEEKDGLKFEKTIENFCINKVYGLRTIVTNCSINQYDLSVFTQIPQGAVPVNSEDYHQIQQVTLREHQYAKYNLYFYFPKPGTFEIYPAALLNNGVVVGRAPEQDVKVLKEKKAEPGEKKNIQEMIRLGDKKSILKMIKGEDVFINVNDYTKFLENDKSFYSSFVQIMQEKNIFNTNVWMYVFRHNESIDVAQQLLNNADFQKKYLKRYSLLYYKQGALLLDLIVFFEFSPIVKFRAHNLENKDRKIQVLNKEFQSAYKKFLIYLIQKQNNMDTSDQLVFCYYLILQERFQECKEIYNRIEKGKIYFNIQYDYLTAYLNMYDGGYPNFQIARKICEKYEDYPIIQWRNMFQEISNKLTEYDENVIIEKEVIKTLEQENPSLNISLTSTQKQSQTRMFKLELDKKGDENLLKFEINNIQEIEINYYILDIEAIFSRNPFFMSEAKFNFVKSNYSENVQVKDGQISKYVNIPKSMANKNLYISAVSGDISQNITVLINQIEIEVLEDFGIITVKRRNKDLPIVKAYIKVFAKMKSGNQVSFYRDGYTDLVGRFDYAMQQYQQNNAANIDRFVILISTEEYGLDIKEVRVPQKDLSQHKKDFSFKQNQMKRTMKQLDSMTIRQDQDEKDKPIIRRASSRKKVKN